MKIAIAVPVYDNVESMFFQSHTKALSYLYECNIMGPDGKPVKFEIETFVTSGIIQEARHRLFADAAKWGADYILWCDSDHVFPENAFARLLSHGKDIVGCNYARRTIQGVPTAPTAAVFDRKNQTQPLCYTTPEKAESGKLERVDHMGLGLCLMNMSVLDRLSDRAEELGRASFLPLFDWPEKEAGSGTGSVGEDVFFFAKCRDAGLDIWCDHSLSWEVGHICKRVLTNAHAEMQRDEWNKGAA